MNSVGQFQILEQFVYSIAKTESSEMAKNSRDPQEERRSSDGMLSKESLSPLLMSPEIEDHDPEAARQFSFRLARPNLGMLDRLYEGMTVDYDEHNGHLAAVALSSVIWRKKFS
ncbi:MAG: hypothetical protein GY835_27535 [bacterium]|nr:hypothetical protein [bacterium]